MTIPTDDDSRISQSQAHQAELLTQMVEQAPFGMILADTALQILEANRFAESVFNSFEPLSGRDLTKLLHQHFGPSQSTEVAVAFRHTLNTGNNSVSLLFTEHPHETAERQCYELEMQRLAVNDRTHCVACYFRDVTQRVTKERQMAEELRILTGQLSDADLRKGEFLENLAHELRNPLSPICNSIQVIRLIGNLDMSVLELLDVMERQAAHLIQVVDDVLKVARVSKSGSEKQCSKSESLYTLNTPSLPRTDPWTLSDRKIPVRKLLVVDDLRVARISLERLLKSMGQDVRSVDCGQKAFEAAMSDTPDMIISDIGMPSMNGYELASRIRSEPRLKNVILVALTGREHSDDLEMAAESGFDLYLTKPANFEDLEKLLSR